MEPNVVVSKECNPPKIETATLSKPIIGGLGRKGRKPRKFVSVSYNLNGTKEFTSHLVERELMALSLFSMRNEGGRGASTDDLISIVGMPETTARNLIKRFLNLGFITLQWRNVGKTHKKIIYKITKLGEEFYRFADAENPKQLI